MGLGEEPGDHWLNEYMTMRLRMKNEENQNCPRSGDAEVD